MDNDEANDPRQNWNWTAAHIFEMCVELCDERIFRKRVGAKKAHEMICVYAYADNDAHSKEMSRFFFVLLLEIVFNYLNANRGCKCSSRTTKSTSKTVWFDSKRNNFLRANLCKKLLIKFVITFQLKRIPAKKSGGNKVFFPYVFISIYIRSIQDTDVIDIEKERGARISCRSN